MAGLTVLNNNVKFLMGRMILSLLYSSYKKWAIMTNKH